MMIRKIFCLGSAFLALGLMGASSYNDYNYLMTHPKQLEAEYKRCQSAEIDSDCLQVKNAVQDFVKLVSDRRDHPQSFGKLILDNQVLLSHLDEKLHSIDKTHAEYAQIHSAYAEQLQKVNTLLSVVAATSM